MREKKDCCSTGHKDTKECCSSATKSSCACGGGEFLPGFFKAILAIMSVLALLAVGYSLGVDKSRQNGYNNTRMTCPYHNRVVVPATDLDIK